MTSGNPIVDAVYGFGKALISPIADHFKHKQAMKELQRKGELAIKTIQVNGAENRANSEQAHEQSWENKSIDNSGWKDEFWTIVIAIPMILSFCGTKAAGWVTDGFVALQGTPEWYQWAVGIAIGSAFGVKKFTQALSGWKGRKPQPTHTVMTKSDLEGSIEQKEDE